VYLVHVATPPTTYYTSCPSSFGQLAGEWQGRGRSAALPPAEPAPATTPQQALSRQRAAAPAPGQQLALLLVSPRPSYRRLSLGAVQLAGGGAVCWQGGMRRPCPAWAPSALPAPAARREHQQLKQVQGGPGGPAGRGGSTAVPSVHLHGRGRAQRGRVWVSSRAGWAAAHAPGAADIAQQQRRQAGRPAGGPHRAAPAWCKVCRWGKGARQQQVRGPGAAPAPAR
jgi:hypothetical protein